MVGTLSITKHGDFFCFESVWFHSSSYSKSRWLFANLFTFRQLSFHHTLPSYYHNTFIYLLALSSQLETLKLLFSPYSVLDIKAIVTTLNKEMDLVEGLQSPNITSTTVASSPAAITY